MANLAAMRALYLSYDGLTDGLGRSQVLPYILGLEEKGHHFTIVSFEKRERFARDEESIRLLLKGRSIAWVPLMYTAFPPILSTVHDVWKLARTVDRLHSEQPFELIHCRSYITSLVGLRMKRKHAVPFIFDMRAFYADERVDGKLWNLDNPLFRAVYVFFKQKEKEFLQEADFTVSLTEKGRDIIHSWDELEGQPLPLEVIPCCADLEHFSTGHVDNALQERLRSETGLRTDDLVFAYLGSIGTWYMLAEMLDFFKVVLAAKQNAKLFFITHDAPDGIWRLAKERGIPEERVIIRSASREEVPTCLSLADIALFFIRPVFSKSGSSPTKHGEMLGMGLPVIANAGVGDVDIIIESTGTGILVRAFEDEDYLNVMAQIDDLLRLPKERMRAAALQFYSLEMGVERYHGIYERVGRARARG
ncbi:MAG: glycosyltransferase [Flavobacteriales bacterium]|nr:glycosyltransferase [Flavobacteriales bacterium]